MSDTTQGRSTEGAMPSSFSQLVIMIATSALQQLGLTPGHDGQRGEVHLDGAQGMIDILETLNTKTSGNLNADEEKILKESLTMLRLQYVEVAQATKRSPTDAAASPSAAPEPAPAPTPDAPKADAKDSEPIAESGGSSENKTRFRKSYG